MRRQKSTEGWTGRRGLALAVVLGLFFWLGGASPSEGAAAQEFTLYTWQEGYQPALYEPPQGIYLGAYIIGEDPTAMTMSRFNGMTGRHHASFFRYVGYGQPFPSDWVEEVRRAGAVPHIALEPNQGLEKVRDDDYLREFLREADRADIPIFLRFASEMNGDWTAYGQDPELFIETWRLLHGVVREEAPRVMMVWTVFTFPEGRIEMFYPGDDYVDWVGVNIYNVVYHSNNLERPADYEDPLKLLDFVYNLYSARKPIQISEYAATHYTVTDGEYYVEWALEKIARLYENLPVLYPRVKSVFYFNHNTLENWNPARWVNNYTVTDQPALLETYHQATGDGYLGEMVQARGPLREKMSWRGNLFFSEGRFFVDAAFFARVLGREVETGLAGEPGEERPVVWVDGVPFEAVTRRIPAGFYGVQRSVTGISIRDFASAFGYGLLFDGGNRSVYLYPPEEEGSVR